MGIELCNFLATVILFNSKHAWLVAELLPWNKGLTKQKAFDSMATVEVISMVRFLC